MTTEIPFTSVASPRSEYERRQEKVLAVVERADFNSEFLRRRSERLRGIRNT